MNILSDRVGHLQMYMSKDLWQMNNSTGSISQYDVIVKDHQWWTFRFAKGSSIWLEFCHRGSFKKNFNNPGCLYSWRLEFYTSYLVQYERNTPCVVSPMGNTAVPEARFESNQASEMERNAQSAGHNNHRSARHRSAVAEFTDFFALDLWWFMVGDANYLMGMILIEHGNLMESPFNII